jgi:hypothetical protein
MVRGIWGGRGDVLLRVPGEWIRAPVLWVCVERGKRAVD